MQDICKEIIVYLLSRNEEFIYEKRKKIVWKDCPPKGDQSSDILDGEGMKSMLCSPDYCFHLNYLTFHRVV